ncbi:AraC family transcriptional regulator [Mucilaginibacter ginsenosidivorax]|uniref:Helix-turn-helix domain-containing protein n=1 Tax=Mucilaginibacter ginsenosidivorax TaxID=862126 RepID=A0A5B8W075_9SPHI|nr:AraC family transcriptional regulator [Mucilaginibacter ginsenosidivorax]QEC76315.1 helix-turn-helix domain-containing protein [Mucilaginibacter ginsenosidivorax]
MQNYQKYLNVGPAEKNWGFYLNTVGSAKVGPNKNYPNNREHPIDHSFTWDKGRILSGYYIVFITKGEGILESAKTKAFEVKAGMCFLLFPGIWHRYKPHPLSGWEEYWVGFNGEYPDELMRKGVFKPEAPFIDVGLNEELLQLFHTLIKTVERAEIGYRQIVTGITLQMLGLLSALSKFHDQTGSKNERLVSKAKFLLQESVENPVSLEDIAKELPMGYSNFRKTFKQVTGLSPNQYHLELRLDKAKNLLAFTNLTVNEIAYQTGFESIFYFSRMFKKKNGLAPKEFRSQLANHQQM